MKIDGLHHITLVTADAQRNVDFYTRVLGLRMVKKTVNFDDPSAYHLYYGDEVGSPGSAVTFFEWPRVPRGRPGIGGTHHFALTVPSYDGLLKWKRRLIDLNIDVDGPFDRGVMHSIYFKDPDGVILEITTRGQIEADPDRFYAPPDHVTPEHRDEDAIAAATWEEPVPVITPDMALMQGMHHISAISSNIERTDQFLTEVLGMQRVRKSANFDHPDIPHWFWAGEQDGLITYFEHDPRKMRFHYVKMGAGQTHHWALRVADDETQLAFRERLLSNGYNVSPVMDRVYFKSIYTRDPDGHIVEIATAGPGFLIDEERDELGTNLMLPPWLEEHRNAIANSLTPVEAPAWSMPEVG